jgi:hypothetical protein
VGADEPAILVGITAQVLVDPSHWRSGRSRAPRRYDHVTRGDALGHPVGPGAVVLGLWFLLRRPATSAVA